MWIVYHLSGPNPARSQSTHPGTATGPAVDDRWAAIDLLTGPLHLPGRSLPDNTPLPMAVLLSHNNGKESESKHLHSGHFIFD